jgi:competence protein ComEA
MGKRGNEEMKEPFPHFLMSLPIPGESGVEKRMGWTLTVLAAAITVAVAGVVLNGYRPASSDSEQAPAEAPVRQNARPPTTTPEPAASVYVHVTGAVQQPGVYTLEPGARILDAVASAGGAAPGADLEAVNLAARVRDGEQVRIPLKRQPAAAHGAGLSPSADQGTGHPPAGTAGPVNLNTAGREELDRLPGIGPATVDKIIAYREEHGAFQQPEELMNVNGIGPARFAKLRDLVAAP